LADLKLGALALGAKRAKHFGVNMLKTIITGSRAMVQGILVRTFDNGQMAVRIGNKVYVGLPVS